MPDIAAESLLTTQPCVYSRSSRQSSHTSSSYRPREAFTPIQQYEECRSYNRAGSAGPQYEECRSYSRAGSAGPRSPDAALVQSPPVVHRTVVQAAYTAGQYNNKDASMTGQCDNKWQQDIRVQNGGGERNYYKASTEPYIEGEKMVLNTINVVNSVKQKFSRF